LGTQETVTINNRQYRDTDDIGHTGNSEKKSIIENTETKTTLGTQETVTINNRQYRDTDNIGHRGNSDNQ
jgi:predicted transport protein